MDYAVTIRQHAQDAVALEALYREAKTAGREDEFTGALELCYQASANELLLTAWHLRLQQVPAAPFSSPAASGVKWQYALPLGLAFSLIIFLLSSVQWMENPTWLGWMPIWLGGLGALVLTAYLVISGLQRWRWPLLVFICLFALLAYATAFAVPIARSAGGNLQGQTLGGQYLLLAIIHCLGAAAVAVWWVVSGWRSAPSGRHAVLIRTIEVAVTAGLFSAVGGFALVLTTGLFGALGITLSNPLVPRISFSLAGGFVPLLATAAIYDPRLQPQLQDFTRGFSKVVAFLLRLFLPVAVLGLVVYIAVIPFYFWQPFQSRDVLIIYNVFLFAIVTLIVGAVPLQTEGLGNRQQKLLRAGVVCVAALTILISLYALAAIIYRTSVNGFTPNRLTVIGWNVINVALLVALVVRQARSGLSHWVAAVSRTISNGVIAYSVWLAILIILLPLLFR